MNHQKHRIVVLLTQLIISSCTGYGLGYDDVRLETSETEQDCLQQPDSGCLLDTAATITATMSEKVAHAEALTVIAKTQFLMGNSQATLNSISDIRLLILQFNALFELSQLARQQQYPGNEFNALAVKITNDTHQTRNKLAALILSAILFYENGQSHEAQSQLQQAIALAKTSSEQVENIIEIQFFSKLLPRLMQFASKNAIKELIAFQPNPALRISAQSEYLILLHNQNPAHAKRLFEQLINKWHGLHDEQQRKIAQAAIIKMMVHFKRLDLARKIQQQETNLVARVSARSIIIQQLTIEANEQNITMAKQELVWLLQDIRQNPIPEIPVNALPQIKLQAAQDKFNLTSLRAQAIADVALGFAKMGRLKEAVHFAEQIQVIMSHIQGYTLTKLAKKYAEQDDINTALLTMESIHRPVNRAACLAEISAQVARSGDLNRAIVIASQINRRSWRDIAYSEIAILQAKQNDIQSAMTTVNTIQRSYSAVYAMAGIAQTLQASQNKR